MHGGEVLWTVAQLPLRAVAGDNNDYVCESADNEIRRDQITGENTSNGEDETHTHTGTSSLDKVDKHDIFFMSSIYRKNDSS